MGHLHVVTGALGYSGRSIAERLIARGDRVRTLTNSGGRPNPFGDALEIHPLNFQDRGALIESLQGARVLFNTYWVRFNHRDFNFREAVENTKVLFACAREAGVGRVVHVSILKPEEGRGLAYYEGKLELESVLMGSGVSHGIVRPGVLFGRGDILVNNIAWVLRHLPVFGVFGDGRYKLQPMHVDDFAELAVEVGDRGANCTVDAVGAEVFEYRELVEKLAEILGVRRPVLACPPWVGYAVSRLVNPIVGDITVTREEIEGLMRGLLVSGGDLRGKTRLTTWAEEHRERLGVRYASEVGRRKDRTAGYLEV